MTMSRMTRLAGAFLFCLVCVVMVGCGSTPTTGDTKGGDGDSGGIDAGKLVGKWGIEKDPEGSMPPGATIEFTKDGKMMLSAKVGDMEVKMDGTYKVADGKLSVTMKDPETNKDKTESNEIKELTDSKFVFIDKGKEVVMKKK